VRPGAAPAPCGDATLKCELARPADVRLARENGEQEPIGNLTREPQHPRAVTAHVDRYRFAQRVCERDTAEARSFAGLLHRLSGKGRAYRADRLAHRCQLRLRIQLELVEAVREPEPDPRPEPSRKRSRERCALHREHRRMAYNSGDEAEANLDPRRGAKDNRSAKSPV
jgi:hypothetical protein